MANPNEIKFAEAWRALSTEATKPGWSTFPISTSSGSLLLAGRQYPHNQESMLIGFATASLPKQAALPQCKGFALEKVELPFHGTVYQCLAITRQASASVDIFSAMLADIVSILERSDRTESEDIVAVIDRIVGWQRFMSREDEGVLNAEDEVGLLGELQVFRLLLGAGVPISQVIEWWLGPSDSLHDFVAPRGDIEVKSSTRVGLFSANVGSLDQLDDSLVQPLYLAAVQFGLSTTGFRLPEFIDSIRSLLQQEPSATTSFEGRLLAAGYHQISASRYHRHFSYLLTAFYEVSTVFPRLTKGNVPLGVVDAKYRIELDTSKLKSVALDDVLQRIG
jgi:Putative  PD-(D/E)XK family member, (DUF4420)